MDDESSAESASWLFPATRAVHRTVAGASDPGSLVDQLPAVLTDTPGIAVAWIGHALPNGGGVVVAAASQELPEVIEPEEGPLLTEQVRETNEGVIRNDPTEHPEFRLLQETGALSNIAGVACLPVGEESVLHLYLTRDPTVPPAPEVFVELAESITAGIERGSLAAELERERERLEAVRSVVSHDLGNPLNLAAGRLDLAETECDSEHLSSVADALERIDALADETVQFVRVGREVTERGPVSLGDLATDCWEYVAGNPGRITIEDATVRAESQRLRMLLNELFRNAEVHTEDEVRVEVGPLATAPGFYVADDGDGIPEDEREFVFDRGYTTVPERDGNGLAIVEEIAAAHGWNVRLAPAEGTRVEINTARW